MSGSLALVGSGEYLPEMADFESALIDDGVNKGKKPIYIQIPTAAAQESDQRLRYWRDLGEQQAQRIGVEVRFLPIYTREDAFKEEFANAIEDSALIYMSGGDPHYLANTLIGTPVWQRIHANWLTGASLAGCSAGAMVMSSEIPNFRFTKREPTLGLNLLPNLRVIPHFDKFFRWIPESAAKVLMSTPDNTVLIGIDEMTALVKKVGSEIWEVHGRSNVHILSGLPRQLLGHGGAISIPGAPRQD